MPKYRKKAVVIDAMQMPPEPQRGGKLRDTHAAVRKVAEWMADNGYRDSADVDLDKVERDFVYGDVLLPDYGTNYLEIETLEGPVSARPGDWIIRGVQGEFYQCKPDIFDATYEPVEEGDQ